MSAEIPGSPLGYSLVHVVAHPDGAAVVDAGLDNPSTRAALEVALDAAGRRLTDVTHVLLTHHHPDHTGLAAHLRATAGAVVAIGAGDAGPLHDPFGAFLDAFADELVAAGTPRDLLELMLEEVRETRRDGQHARRRARRPPLAPGEPVALGTGAGAVRLDVLHVPGHTAGHVAFLDRARRILFCGDALLPAGLIQLDVLVAPDDNPLADLLRSLKVLAGCGADLALPGHGGPYGDVPAVAAAQRARQLERRDAVARVLAAEPGLTAWEVGARLSQKPWDEVGIVSRRYMTMELAAVMRSLGAPPAQDEQPTSSSAR